MAVCRAILTPRQPKSGRIGITFLSIFILLCLLFLGFTLLAMIYGFMNQSSIFKSCCGFRPDYHEQIELIHKYEEKLAEKQSKKWFKGKQQEEEKPVKEEMDAGAAGEETSRKRVRFANKETDTEGNTETDGSKESGAEITTVASGDRTLARERAVAGSSDGVFVNPINPDEDEGEDMYSVDGRRPPRPEIDLRRARFTPEQQQGLRDADARDMRDMGRESLATDTAGQQEMHQMPPSENLTRLQKARLRYEKWLQKK